MGTSGVTSMDQADRKPNEGDDAVLCWGTFVSDSAAVGSGPRRWGAVVSAVMGTLLAQMLYGLLHPGSVVAAASRIVFAPFCHQLPERSFQFGGAAMCVCHRCFGIYLGLFVGGLLAFAGVRADLSRRGPWLWASMPMVVHVLVLNLWPPADLWPLRVATGLLFGAWGGLALSVALGHVLGQPHDLPSAPGPTSTSLHLREERT